MASSAANRGGTQLPHHTTRSASLDPPTRLNEGKPSRKNRPPFHGRKRTTATTLPPPLSSRPFLVTTTTTVGTLPSLSPAPPSPSLYRRLLLHRDQPSSHGTRIPELTDFDRLVRSFEEAATTNSFLSPASNVPRLRVPRSSDRLKFQIRMSVTTTTIYKSARVNYTGGTISDYT